jgi:hypothetical protein
MLALDVVTGGNVIVSAAVYIGALIAIIRPDHRNPLTRPVMDRIERYTKGG